MLTRFAEGKTIDWYNGTGSAVDSGQPVNIGGRMGIACTDIAAAGYGAVDTEGIHILDAVAGLVFNHGDDVYWDAAQEKATLFAMNASGANVYLGKARAGETVGAYAKTSAATTCYVQLCQPANPTRRVLIDEDFINNLIANSLTITDTSSAGAPTTAITSAHGGQLELTLAATNEAENICASNGDVLNIDLDQGPIAEFLATVTTIPANSGEIITIGLASARNDTPGTITEHLVFALDTDGHLLVQTDDGTHDISDTDTGVNVTNGTTLHLAIDARSAAAVKFFVNGEDKTAVALAAATNPTTAFNMASAATGLLQLYFQVQKSSGTTQPSLKVDRVRVTAAA